MLEGVALRSFNVFGPRQSPDSAYAAVIPVFMAAAQAGTAAPLYGDGGQTRDFTYVDNVVRANLLAGEGPAAKVSGAVCTVGAGDRTSLLQLLEMIGEVAGRPVAIERLPDDPRRYDLHYNLAHAYRRTADTIRGELGRGEVGPRRDEHGRRLRELLSAAVANYSDAIDGYQQIPSHQRTTLENESLKLAYLWRADCVFEKGDYAAARDLYESIANQYANDPVALTARMQIVNAYAQEGSYKEARTAQNRALRMLREMPDSAFDNELLDREAWEEWLSWGAKLEQTANADTP